MRQDTSCFTRKRSARSNNAGPSLGGVERFQLPRSCSPSRTTLRAWRRADLGKLWGITSPGTEIYFLHIAKTGGMSVISLIQSAYSQGEVMPVHEWQYLKQLTHEQINSYRCYTGHFGTGLYSLLDRDIPTVTFLRDPFEQTVSHMQHALRAQRYEPELPIYLRLLWRHLKIPQLRRRWNLPDFPIPLTYFSQTFVDFQTHALGVEVDMRTSLDEAHTHTFIQRSLEAQGNPSRDSLLVHAKQRLDSMAVVGTVERFSESVELVCDFLDIPTPASPPEVNVAPGKRVHSRYRASKELSPELAALIDANTRYDQELYAYANKLLDQKLALRAKAR